MPDVRESFPFGGIDLGVVSTDTVNADAVSSFLTSSPDDIVLKEDEDTVKKPIAKTTSKKEEVKEEVKEEQVPTGQELAEKLLGGEEEEEREEEEQEQKAEPEGDTNVFAQLTSELLNLGIFTKDEEEQEIIIDTPEDFKERFEYEKKKGASQILEAYLGRFGDEYTEMFDSVFVKGVSPREYLSAVQTISDIENIDLTDEGNQEKVVREMLRKEGKPADYINKRIERLKNYNDLEEEAKDAKNILVQQESQSIAQKAEAKALGQQQKTEARKQYVTAVNKILSEKLETKEFDGIPVDPKFAQEIADYVIREKYKVGDNELLTEFDKELLDLKRPENYALRVKLAMLLKMVKVDPTLSKIQKKAVTKEKNQLFQNLVKTTKTPARAPDNQTPQQKSWFSK